MKDYILFTDSTVDLPNQLAQEMEIGVLPLTFFIEGKTYRHYLDEREFKLTDFYNVERQGVMPTTSQINVNEFIECFEPIIKEGKEILYISFSSALSGTFNSVNLAIKTLKEDYPDCKIIAIDSKSQCMGEGLLVYEAAKKKKSGLTIDQLADYVNELIPKVNHWFTVEDIGHLKRGGRLSNSSAFIAKMLKIKPFMFTNEKGELHVVKKCFGRKSAIRCMIEKIASKPEIEGYNTIMICHGDCLEDANYLANEIKKIKPDKEIIINMMGPVIGAHVGPGTLALFFVSEDRN